MSVERKAVKVAKITSVGIAAFSAGAFILREVSRKREDRQRTEYIQQSAGDSGILFQREGLGSR